MEPYGRRFAQDLGAQARAIRGQVTDYLRSQGYDGLRMLRDAADDGRWVETMVVFDPHNLRRMSPRTRFDPMDSGSSNLLASLTAAGVLAPATLSAFPEAASAPPEGASAPH